MIYKSGIRARKYSPMEVNNIFRMLWEENSFWIRSFIVSTVENLPDLPLVTQRLLRNSVDFGAAFHLFYDYDQSEVVLNVLREHLLIMIRFINALKARDTIEEDLARRELHLSGQQIARLLASMNPYWLYDVWSNLYNLHTRMVEEMAVQRLRGDHSGDIMTFDSLESQSLLMADVMSQGIIAQYRL